MTPIVDFIKYTIDFISNHKGVSINKYPKIVLTLDKSKTTTLAHFQYGNECEIVVYVKDRLLADVYRSLSHELVHYFQYIKGELQPNSGDTGSDIENEANSLAGIILRNYSKNHPEILQTPYNQEDMVNKPTLQGNVDIISELDKMFNEDLVILPKKNNDSSGCLMLYYEPCFWDKIVSLIDESDIYKEDDKYGIESEPHVTVLYGFTNDMDVTRIEDYLNTIKSPIQFSLEKIDIFENEKFDVVKFNVKSPQLHVLHSFFKENFDNVESYPTYQPHSTIAYVKKGMGRKYKRSLKTPIIVDSSHFVYSTADREQYHIDPLRYDTPTDVQEVDVMDDDYKDFLSWLSQYISDGTILNEAEYQGRSVQLNKPMKGDVKKFKVYVKNKNGKVVKVNFGSKDYKIKKNNPDRKKSYCSRSAGIEGGGKDKTKANYWSRKMWNC